MRLHLDIAALDVLITSNAQRHGAPRADEFGARHHAHERRQFHAAALTAQSARPRATLEAQARPHALDEFINDANSSDGDGYLFGGINSPTPPLADLTTAPKSALDAAFLAKFGVTQDDPAAANIGAADMAISSTTNSPPALRRSGLGHDLVVRLRPSHHAAASRQTETVNTSVSANEPALRKLAMAYSMVGDARPRRISARMPETPSSTRQSRSRQRGERSRSTLQTNLGTDAEPHQRRERAAQRAAEPLTEQHRRAGGRRPGRGQGRDRHADAPRSRCPTR